LLRHPEYWVYAGTTQQARLSSAEAQFNRLAFGAISQKTRQQPAQSSTPKGVLPAAQRVVSWITQRV